MTNEQKLAVLRSLKLGHDKEWMTKPLKEALDYAIQCVEAIQRIDGKQPCPEGRSFILNRRT